MQSYYSATIWNKNTTFKKPPYTCKKAQPFDSEYVQNLPVIDVIDASYRKAIFSGSFVLSPFVPLPLPTSGTGKIDVLCRWFDHRLTSTGLSLIVDYSKVQFHPIFTGYVVSDIAK